MEKDVKDDQTSRQKYEKRADERRERSSIARWPSEKRGEMRTQRVASSARWQHGECTGSARLLSTTTTTTSWRRRPSKVNGDRTNY